MKLLTVLAALTVVLILCVGGANAQTTTTSTTDGTVSCLALGCPGSPTTSTTSGCAYRYPDGSCRTTDGNPPVSLDAPLPDPVPTPIARFAG